MKLVALSDIHGHIAPLTKAADDLRAADVVVLSGDITNFGKADAVAEVVNAVRAYNPVLFAVLGNCDHPDCEIYLVEIGISIHCRTLSLDGVSFAGLSGSLPCLVRTLNESTEGEMRNSLRVLSESIELGVPWVFVTHQPPYDTIVDLAHNGKHVGSHAVREFIEEMQPLICFTGHIHEGCGIDRIGRTEVINPGSFASGSYAVAELDGDVQDVVLRTL